MELRDGDKSRYLGKGVTKAVENINTVIRNAFVKKVFLGITSLPGAPSLVWKNMDKLAETMSWGYECRDVVVNKNTCCMDIVRCSLYDKAKELGNPEAAQMICCMDKEYMTGIRGLDYRRTKALAEGHDCCDYRMKRTDPSGM